MITLISNIIFASILIGIPIFARLKGVSILQSFFSGSKQGIKQAFTILPYIIAMYIAVGMLQASNFFTIIADIISPYIPIENSPPELLSLALLRPVSGSGTIAILADIIEKFGPDSLVSRIACTMFGSTETTLYVIAIYFGAISVKRYRHALAVGLIADFIGILSSILICNLLFSS